MVMVTFEICLVRRHLCFTTHLVCHRCGASVQYKILFSFAKNMLTMPLVSVETPWSFCGNSVVYS
jgi:hypothetical protein